MTATYTQLRDHDRTVANLMADPDITGDLLLIGLWLARAVHLNQPVSGDGRRNLVDCARDLFPPQLPTRASFNGETDPEPVPGPDGWRVVGILKADIRRYDPFHGHTDRTLRGVCQAPMIRREKCGRRSYTWRLLTDVDTGRRYELAVCSRHVDWFHAQTAANREAVRNSTMPVPAANTGGLLARHFPEIDWPVLWKALDPEWVAPPEDTPAPGKPKLRLIVTGIIDAEPARSTEARPNLAVVKGLR